MQVCRPSLRIVEFPFQISYVACESFTISHLIVECNSKQLSFLLGLDPILCKFYSKILIIFLQYTILHTGNFPTNAARAEGPTTVPTQ